MELRHLEYFVAVAEEENFTRAAARMHIVQSAVSAAIKSLERELGVALLDRNSKRVLLTDAGAALLPRARVALDAARAARDAVDEVRGGLRGTLRIGTMTTIRLIDMPALLGEYHRRHPCVQLHTSAATSGSKGLVEALTERRLDLAFISQPGVHPAGIAVRDLASSVLDLVVPAGHPLARQSPIKLNILADLDFIDSPLGYGNRSVADRAFEAAGVRRNVSIEISDIATGAAYVRHGLGVALLPRFVLTDEHDVHVKVVTGADLNWPLSIATRSDHLPSAAASALIGLIEEFLRVTQTRRVHEGDTAVTLTEADADLKPPAPLASLISLVDDQSRFRAPAKGRERWPRVGFGDDQSSPSRRLNSGDAPAVACRRLDRARACPQEDVGSPPTDTSPSQGVKGTTRLGVIRCSGDLRTRRERLTESLRRTGPPRS